MIDPHQSRYTKSPPLARENASSLLKTCLEAALRHLAALLLAFFQPRLTRVLTSTSPKVKRILSSHAGLLKTSEPTIQQLEVLALFQA